MVTQTELLKRQGIGQLRTDRQLQQEALRTGKSTSQILFEKEQARFESETKKQIEEESKKQLVQQLVPETKPSPGLSPAAELVARKIAGRGIINPGGDVGKEYAKLLDQYYASGQDINFISGLKNRVAQLNAEENPFFSAIPGTRVITDVAIASAAGGGVIRVRQDGTTYIDRSTTDVEASKEVAGKTASASATRNYVRQGFSSSQAQILALESESRRMDFTKEEAKQVLKELTISAPPPLMTFAPPPTPTKTTPKITFDFQKGFSEEQVVSSPREEKIVQAIEKTKELAKKGIGEVFGLAKTGFKVISGKETGVPLIRGVSQVQTALDTLNKNQAGIQKFFDRVNFEIRNIPPITETKEGRELHKEINKVSEDTINIVENSNKIIEAYNSKVEKFNNDIASGKITGDEAGLKLMNQLNKEAKEVEKIQKDAEKKVNRLDSLNQKAKEIEPQGIARFGQGFMEGGLTLIPTLTEIGFGAVTEPGKTAKQLAMLPMTIPEQLVKDPFGFGGELVGQAVTATAAVRAASAGIRAATTRAATISRVSKLKTDFAIDFDVADSVNIGTDAFGNSQFKLNAKITTKLINRKTGKVIETVKTDHFSDVITARTAEGAIRAYSEGIAESLRKGGARKYVKQPKVTITKDLKSATTKAVLRPSEIEDVFTGTFESEILEAGKKMAKAKPVYAKDLGFADVIISKDVFKRVGKRVPTKSTGLGQIMVKAGKPHLKIRRFGDVLTGGIETFDFSKALTDLTKETYKVKGYKKKILKERKSISPEKYLRELGKSKKLEYYYVKKELLPKGVLGEFRFDKFGEMKDIIRIRKGLKKSLKKEVIAHEITHAKTPKLIYKLPLEKLPYKIKPSEIIAELGEKYFSKKGFKPKVKYQKQKILPYLRRFHTEQKALRDISQGVTRTFFPKQRLVDLSGFEFKELGTKARLRKLPKPPKEIDSNLLSQNIQKQLLGTGVQQELAAAKGVVRAEAQQIGRVIGEELKTKAERRATKKVERDVRREAFKQQEKLLGADKELARLWSATTPALKGLAKQKELSKSKQREEQLGSLLGLTPLVNLRDLTRTVDIQKTNQTQALVTLQKQELAQQQVFSPFAGIVPTVGVPRVPKPPKKPRIIIPPLFKDEGRMFIDKNANKPHDVFIREGGKYTKITKQPLPNKAEAKDVGSWVTDNTLSAEFVVRPSKKKPGAFPFNPPPNYWELTKPKFREFRQRRGQIIPLVNTFIEGKEYRLDTNPEVRKISAARFLSEQNKRTQELKKYNKGFSSMFGFPANNNGKILKQKGLNNLFGFNF